MVHQWAAAKADKKAVMMVDWRVRSENCSVVRWVGR